MPSNHILINNALECFVVDSKMEELMEFLRLNAYDWAEKYTNSPLLSGVNSDEVILCIPTLA